MLLHCCLCVLQSYIRRQMQAIDANTSLDEVERARRKQVHSVWYMPYLRSSHPQNLLRLSLGAAGAGVSPEAGQLQSHSLPSSVSDALEAMGMEDLHLEELEAGALRDDPQEVCHITLKTRPIYMYMFNACVHVHVGIAYLQKMWSLTCSVSFSTVDVECRDPGSESSSPRVHAVIPASATPLGGPLTALLNPPRSPLPLQYLPTHRTTSEHRI